MKKILMCIFLIGLFAKGWSSSPPSDNVNQCVKAGIIQSGVKDQVQATVINAADETLQQLTVTPAKTKWVDMNLLQTVSGVILLAYEFLALKLPTSKSVSLLGNAYKLLTWFIPDKSKNGGKFVIRDN